MPSLADIPEHIINEKNPGAFVNWIAEIPLDRATRSILAKLYDRATGQPMKQRHYDAIFAGRKLP